MIRPTSLLLLALLLVPSSPASAGPTRASTESSEFFEKQIRPVLVQHCYSCHSSEAKKTRGGLRLDSRVAMLKGGDSGPALVPGQPDKSRLIEAIRYSNVDLQMPPRQKLTSRQIDDLVAWVKMDAPWPADAVASGAAGRDTFDLAGRRQAHWSWKPIQPVSPPTVHQVSWPLAPSDRFILAGLEKAGLSPALPADRATLLRRLSFDLTGLPPSPREIDEFTADTSDLALERVVDRLMTSPRFGERWARHWLDLVRYAETRGHEFDFPIPNAFQYRDYVIRAINADVPQDQFIREHLAGDLLPTPRRNPEKGFNESILGTGFWFLGEEVHSPVDVRADQADRFDNRIDVFSKAFLGLTVSCARCHDHKFDAISQKDYYALFGFLASSNYRQVRFDSLDHNRKVASQLDIRRDREEGPLRAKLASALRPAIQKLAETLTSPTKAWTDHLAHAKKDREDPFHAFAGRSPNKGEARATREEVVVDYSTASSAAWMPDDVGFGSRPVRRGELRVEGSAEQPVFRVAPLGAATSDPFWRQQKVVGATDNEPGALGQMVRSGKTLRTPTFRLTTGKVWYLVRGEGLAYASIGGHIVVLGPLHGRVVQSIKAGPTYSWVGHDLNLYKGLFAHIEFSASPRTDFAVARVVQAEHQPALPSWTALDHLLQTTRTPRERAEGYQRLFTQTLDQLEAGKLDADHARLADWLVTHLDLLGVGPEQQRELARPVLAALDEIQRQAQLDSRLAPAMQDGNGIDENLFIRGAPRAPGVVVPRRFLEALAGPEPISVRTGSGRLELASQLTDPERNPFLARVAVNRIWHHLFGRGIVASVDDFGVMGQPPTHPELLDYLAARFIREGWSLKKMIRLLVLSRAYQMASDRSEQGDKIDPDNRLLHRANLRRLEGEAIRDAMLALSGRLDLTMYGPAIPIHLTDFQQGRGRPGSGPIDGAGRRSIYLAVRRNFLSSFLLAFDTPTPFSTVGRRTVSNVPAQALILMNDPFVHQQAGLWGRAVLASKGSPREKLARMYVAAFGRQATPAELEACTEFLRESGKDEPAAWSDLAHALINVKEFIFLR